MNAYQPPSGESSPIPDEEAVKLRRRHLVTERAIEAIALVYVWLGAFLMSGAGRVLHHAAQAGWPQLTPPLVERARESHFADLRMKALVLAWMVSTALVSLIAGFMLARMRKAGVVWSLFAVGVMFGLPALSPPSERYKFLAYLAALLASHGLFMLDSPRTVMTALYRAEAIGRTPRSSLFMYLAPLVGLLAVAMTMWL